jgi:AcrR family transcriptional regulator
VEAAVSLHTTIGPARTSFNAVAEKAGVSRPTLYRYFPDLPSLFGACTTHGMAADPLPDPSVWNALAHPGERLLRGLIDLYGYYRRNRGISLHMARDTEVLELLGDADVPSVAAGPHPEARVLRLIAQMRPLMETRNRVVLETLLAPWRAAELVTAELESALAVVIRIDTWRTLAMDRGHDDETAARIATAMVEGLVRKHRPRDRSPNRSSTR